MLQLLIVSHLLKVTSASSKDCFIIVVVPVTTSTFKDSIILFV